MASMFCTTCSPLVTGDEMSICLIAFFLLFIPEDKVVLDNAEGRTAVEMLSTDKDGTYLCVP